MNSAELLARLDRLECDRDALHDRVSRLEQRPAANEPPSPPSDLTARLTALESALGINSEDAP